MGIVSQGAECLSGQCRGLREAPRRAKGLKASPSKVLLFFGNFVPLARHREPVKEGQG